MKTLFSVILFGSFLAGSMQAQDVNPLEKYRNSRFVTLEKGQDFIHWVNTKAISDDGRVWISSGDLLYVFDGVSLEIKAKSNKPEMSIFSHMCIVNDTILLSEEAGELYCYPINSKEDSFIPFRRNIWFIAKVKMSNQKIFLADNNGTIWEYEDGDFKVKYELPNRFKKNESYTQDCLVEDPLDSNFLIYYFQNHIHRINVNSFENTSSSSSLEGGIDLLKSDGNRYYVGLKKIGSKVYMGSNYDGLIQYDFMGNNWKSFKVIPPYFNEPHSNHYICGVEELDDRYLLISGAITKIFDSKDEKFYNFSRDHIIGRQFSNRPLGSMLIDRGNIYAMNWEGGFSIISSNHNKFNNVNLAKIDLAGADFQTTKGIFIDENRIALVDSFQKTSKILNLNKLKFDDDISAEELNFIASNDGQNYNHNVKEALASSYRKSLDSVQFIQKDSAGNIWRFEGDKLNKYSSNDKMIKGIDLKSEFGISELGGFLIDDNNDVWMGTQKGILFANFESESYELFDENDGLISNDWTSNMICGKSSKGILFFKSDDHLTFFNPREFKARKDIVPYVQKIEVLDRKLLFNAREKIEIEVKPKEEYFTIYYSAQNSSKGKSTKFEYKLEGYDERWIEGRTDHLASYKYVPPGKYEFMLRAHKLSGEGSSIFSTATISVHAEWYEALWFKLMVLLSGILLIFGFYKIKTDSIRKEERIKADFKEQLSKIQLVALRSQMNPHFIFNCLNSIDNFILSNDTRNASEYLGKFAKLVRKILDFSQSDEITLWEEMDALNLYITMEQMRFSSKFDYDLIIDPLLNMEAVNIPPLILQPYVENAIWHGLMHLQEKGTLLIQLSVHGKFFHCVIEDNGIGRKKAIEIKSKSATTRKSLGMKITQDRLQLLNDSKGLGGKVVTEDKFDDMNRPLGTKVTLVLPL